jgi:excisionase family DNA binding protein
LREAHSSHRSNSSNTAHSIGGTSMGDLSDARFLTVAEVADMMRVSNMTVYRMVQRGELPAIRFGRSYRIPESAVATAIELPDSRQA